MKTKWLAAVLNLIPRLGKLRWTLVGGLVLIALLTVFTLVHSEKPAVSSASKNSSKAAVLAQAAPAPIDATQTPTSPTNETETPAATKPVQPAPASRKPGSTPPVSPAQPPAAQPVTPKPAVQPNFAIHVTKNGNTLTWTSDYSANGYHIIFQVQGDCNLLPLTIPCQTYLTETGTTSGSHTFGYAAGYYPARALVTVCVNENLANCGMAADNYAYIDYIQ